ncbi:hypothetical protein KIPB_008666 [Kipferlia bialata]|uniref:Kelch-type beta propeller n=1 Tax=Kipferlia bialata TaxID=797122 RepID=A0A391NXN4_9EUKA|nr:hypothetical protein KIPB_008666 [Kipferlia bialata]|eukprot:g8666.t1
MRDMECYDTATGTWAKSIRLPKDLRQRHIRAGVIDGVAHILAGHDHYTYTVWETDSVGKNSSTWVRKRRPPFEQALAVQVIDRTLVVLAEPHPSPDYTAGGGVLFSYDTVSLEWEEDTQLHSFGDTTMRMCVLPPGEDSLYLAHNASVNGPNTEGLIHLHSNIQ